VKTWQDAVRLGLLVAMATVAGAMMGWLWSIPIAGLVYLAFWAVENDPCDCNVHGYRQADCPWHGEGGADGEWKEGHPRPRDGFREPEGV
jgi:hypothetical protein